LEQVLLTTAQSLFFINVTSGIDLKNQNANAFLINCKKGPVFLANKRLFVNLKTFLFFANEYAIMGIVRIFGQRWLPFVKSFFLDVCWHQGIF
jgi:hypothetical protein